MTDKIKLPTNRNFGIVFFIVFLLISLWPLIDAGDLRVWSLIVSFIFLVLGLLNSSILNPLNKLWYKFGIILGNLISPLIMGIIFFTIVTPIAYILRIFKKDVLKLKFRSDEINSYWIKKENLKNSMKKQF
tara:strand:- start:4677 stop:5069 length:393 start_codon:yes stop_codon:yes gene_type:complete